MQNYNLFELQSKTLTGSRPVTAQEVKDYLRIEGFQDTDDSDATPFTEDDTLIEQLIDSAIEILEQRNSILIQRYTVEATVTNLAGNIDIYGPVDVDSFTLEQEDGTAITDLTLVGSVFPKLKSPKYENMKATYDAGYATLPANVKTEILKLVAYMYENREGEAKGFPFSNSLNRTSWLW